MTSPLKLFILRDSLMYSRLNLKRLVKRWLNKSRVKHLKQTKFSRRQLSIFVLAFALVGSYVIYRSFAAVPVSPSLGIWLSPAEVQSLPMTGASWSAVQNAANSSWGTANLSDNNSNHDVNTLAGALVATRTGDSVMRDKTIAGLESAMVSPLSRTLELARGLQTYIIAADIIGYRTPEFENWIEDMLVRPIDGRVGTGLYNNALKDSTNWGGHERASCIAAALYLGDTTRLDELTRAYREYIGENVSPKTLTYQSTNWHADPSNKAGVNRLGSRISGQDVSGVIPEDWRRGSEFAWPPVPSGYMWEGMQGFVVSAVLLHRAGKVTFTSGDNVLVRAMNQLMSPVNPPNPGINYPPGSDDAWIAWLVNYYANSSYPTQSTSPGKNMGYTDWTHAALTPPSSDTTPPTVSVTAPTSGASVSGSNVALSASATDNVGTVGVQFKVNGTNIGGEDTVAPYTTTLNSTIYVNGSYNLTAVARDAAGNTATSAAINFMINNPNPTPSDTTPPTVSLTSPAGGTTVTSGSVALVATAGDNVAVAGVQFYLNYTGDPNSNKVGSEDTSSPYTRTLTTTTLGNGSHTISAISRDTAGNLSTPSTITITVNNLSPPPPDTTAPTTPTGLTASNPTTTTISLSWNASTDTGGSGLAGYRLYRNGTLITTTTLLNYTDNNLGAGLTPGTSYSYRISAIDYANNASAQSSAVNASTTSNPAPVVTTTTKLGDLNGDNLVNIFDLSILLSRYNGNGTGDLNNSGRVDILDLSILLSRYGG